MPIVKITILDDDSNKIRETLDLVVDRKETAMDTLAIANSLRDIKEMAAQLSTAITTEMVATQAFHNKIGYLANQIRSEADVILNVHMAYREPNIAPPPIEGARP